MTFDNTPFPLLTILVLLTIIVIFGMKYWSLSRQVSGKAAGETAYRTLAEKSAEAQTAGAAALTALQSDVADIRRRLASVETVLKDVG